ncbi:hypothetical protein KJ870_06075 [bacterium]|nr:hypothetical protein [bacterium]MBU1434485.1 hypothetical protein [bacterium]MBU1502063.1 hypothetical protein [bacterium]
MTPIKKIKLNDAIILTKILDDGSLLVVDEYTTCKYYNLENLDVIGGFKANITHLRYKTDVVAFSSDGEYFAAISSDCHDSKLYNTSTKKTIAKMDRHHGEVSCVGIDPKNRYMFSCGDDGKTFAIDIHSGKLAFTLPIHVDTINDIAFSSNGNWVATASYDKNISLFNIATMTPKNKLKLHDSPVMKLKFIANNRLISVDKNSVVFVWNALSGKILAKLQGVHDDVTHITLSEDNNFLFLGTLLGYVLAYDLKTYELISRNFVKLSSAITAMEFRPQNNELILGTANGELLFYNIYEGEEYLRELLSQKKYDEIQKQSEVNPFLVYTQIYELVSNLWEKTLAQAKLYLEKSDKKTAIKLFNNFKDIPAKKNIIQKVLLEYADFDKFLLFAKQEKYTLAYSLANAHPMYKDSKIYKILESRWKKAFALAQQYTLDPKGADKAREILAPYRGISEKTRLIQELLTQSEVYKRFRVALGQKDFKVAFELIKLNPFLMEFEEYETLMRYADTLYIKSQEFIQNGDTHSAIKLLRVLSDFSDFSQEVKELILNIEAKQKFFNAIKEEDIILAYNLLDKNEDLQETPDGQKLQMAWNSDLSKASEFAAKGDVDGIISVINPYMKVSSKHMSFGTLFGWCYMVQLENAIKMKKEKAQIENGIKNYILNFGLQDQIENIFNVFKEYYPDSKLTLELQTKGSLAMWRPSMIVKSILE